MKHQPKILDTFQIVGFLISSAISIGFILAGQDTVPSVTLGLILGVLTQLFDLQIRHSDSEQRLLQSNILSHTLYQDEWLLKHIQQIIENYQSVRSGRFKPFKLRAMTPLLNVEMSFIQWPRAT